MVTSDDDACSIDVGVGLAHGFDDPFTASFAGPEIDEEDLIEIMMNDLGQERFEFGKFGRCELAFKDAELKMITPIAHGFEDLAETFVIANVVGNDHRVSHDGSSKSGPWKRIRTVSIDGLGRDSARPSSAEH